MRLLTDRGQRRVTTDPRRGIKPRRQRHYFRRRLRALLPRIELRIEAHAPNGWR